MATLPWSTDLRSLLAEAANCDQGAACLFAIEDGIPEAARAGYAALVIAYARDGEPVTIFDDGAALLLIKNGGVASARIAGERIMSEMHRLGLQSTLRAAVIGVDGQPDTLADRVREVVKGGSPGTVTG